MYPRFELDISRMNQTYQLGKITQPEYAGRLVQLRKILGDEVKEIDDIILEADKPNLTSGDYLRIKTDVADILGDLVVYCVSEAHRWNIPLSQVLGIIMESNFSKLGADGQPIMKDGKFQKGPNYCKPEPRISSLLRDVAMSDELQKVYADNLVEAASGSPVVALNMQEIAEAASKTFVQSEDPAVTQVQGLAAATTVTPVTAAPQPRVGSGNPQVDPLP